MVGHLSTPPVPFAESDPEGRVPDEVREILLATLAKKPEERIASADELARRLASLQDPLADDRGEYLERVLQRARQKTAVVVPVPPPPPAGRSRRRSPRRSLHGRAPAPPPAPVAAPVPVACRSSPGAGPLARRCRMPRPSPSLARADELGRSVLERLCRRNPPSDVRAAGTAMGSSGHGGLCDAGAAGRSRDPFRGDAADAAGAFARGVPPASPVEAAPRERRRRGRS